jgi:hypothetical protein
MNGDNLLLDEDHAELKTYRTGKPCKHGHVAERYVSDRSCVICRAKQKPDPEVREYQAAYARQRRQQQGPEVREYHRQYNKQRRQEDPAFRARLAERDRRRWQQDPVFRAKKAEWKRQRYQTDPELRAKAAEYGQRRWQDPDFRTNRAEYRRQRRQTDPNFRLGNALRTRIWMALKHNWKSGHTLELLGCTIDHLWDHLEHQFQPGMTRANMGKIWHIDHCRPCASFDLTDPAQQRECFGFMNLQPLFSAENLGKHAKPETEEQFVDRTERYWRIAA